MVEAVGTAGLGAFTDLIFDGAGKAFEVEEEAESIQQGRWIYVYRGQEHNKLIRAEELASESTMFQDSDGGGPKAVLSRVLHQPLVKQR